MSYLGEYTVSKLRPYGNLSVTIRGNPFDHIEVTHGDPIKILDLGSSVFVVPGQYHTAATVLARYKVHRVSEGLLQSQLFKPALEPLGVKAGDVVEIYDRHVGIELFRGEP